MSIIVWIIVGLIAGLLARAIVPGPQPMGLISTTLLGIAGSFIGGLIAQAVVGARGTGFSFSNLIGSVIGAIILLLIWTAIRGRARVTT